MLVFVCVQLLQVPVPKLVAPMSQAIRDRVRKLVGEASDEALRCVETILVGRAYAFARANEAGGSGDQPADRQPPQRLDARRNVRIKGRDDNDHIAGLYAPIQGVPDLHGNPVYQKCDRSKRTFLFFSDGDRWIISTQRPGATSGTEQGLIAWSPSLEGESWHFNDDQLNSIVRSDKTTELAKTNGGAPRRVRAPRTKAAAHPLAEPSPREGGPHRKRARDEL